MLSNFPVRLSWNEACGSQDRLSADFANLGCIVLYCVQLVAVVCPDAVLELAGGPCSPWMAPEKREVLAEILVQALRLKVGRRGLDTLNNLPVYKKKLLLSTQVSLVHVLFFSLVDRAEKCVSCS